MFKPIIIIPFYNHLDCFSRVAKGLQHYSCPKLIVNDGSTQEESEGIKKLCKKFDFIYIELEKNQGKGQAVITAMNYAIKNKYTHILQVDADGQHQYGDVEKFLNASQNNPDSIINGCPVYDSSIPKSRLYGRKITNFWVKIETGNAPIADTMCGFRVYPAHKIADIIGILLFKRMGFDTEVIVKSYLNGINIVNLPTKVVYPEYGVSHFKGFLDNVEITMMHASLCCYALYKLLFKRGKNV